MIKKENVQEITPSEFSKIINDKKNNLAIVDFFAEWCLDPKTKLILNPCIKDMGGIKRGLRVLSFDENFKEEYAEIKSTHKIIHDQQIKVLTERGREIICTPEHLILTKNGFKTAKDLNNEDLVATYLFSSYPEIEDDGRIFLNEADIRNKAAELGILKEEFINELKKRNLINIKYGDEKANVLASLIGLLLSDGSLSMCNNNERLTEFYVANESDIKEVAKDLAEIGFEVTNLAQESKGKINEREFTQKIIRMRNSKTSLLLLLSALGGVVGDKFINGIKIPDWIKTGPKQIKKSFLQGFLGGDGCKIHVITLERENYKEYNKAIVNPIELHFYSEAKNSAELFGKEFSDILEEFGVNIDKVEILNEERWERKDGRKSIFLKIKINSGLNSVYNYACIGFKYAYNKKYESSIAKEYLLDRLSKIKERKIKRAIVLNMKDKLSVNELAKELNLSYSVISNWISGKDAGQSHDSIKYDAWKQEYIKDKIAYDKIKVIEKISGSQKEFISISLNNNTKMFVANEIIHHNCMPCVMMGPVFQRLSEKFKQVKFAKINVDEASEIAQEYEVSSIPCIIFFKDGKEVDRVVGGVGEGLLEEKISDYIKLN